MNSREPKLNFPSDLTPAQLSYMGRYYLRQDRYELAMEAYKCAGSKPDPTDLCAHVKRVVKGAGMDSLDSYRELWDRLGEQEIKLLSTAWLKKLARSAFECDELEVGYKIWEAATGEQPSCDMMRKLADQRMREGNEYKARKIYDMMSELVPIDLLLAKVHKDIAEGNPDNAWYTLDDQYGVDRASIPQEVWLKVADALIGATSSTMDVDYALKAAKRGGRKAKSYISSLVHARFLVQLEKDPREAFYIVTHVEREENRRKISRIPSEVIDLLACKLIDAGDRVPASDLYSHGSGRQMPREILVSIIESYIEDDHLEDALRKIEDLEDAPWELFRRIIQKSRNAQHPQPWIEVRVLDLLKETPSKSLLMRAGNALTRVQGVLSPTAVQYYMRAGAVTSIKKLLMRVRERALQGEQAYAEHELYLLSCIARLEA